MRDREFLTIVAALLIGGTNSTPEEGIAKAQALIAAAKKVAHAEGEED